MLDGELKKLATRIGSDTVALLETHSFEKSFDLEDYGEFPIYTCNKCGVRFYITGEERKIRIVLIAGANNTGGKMSKVGSGWYSGWSSTCNELLMEEALR